MPNPKFRFKHPTHEDQTFKQIAVGYFQVNIDFSQISAVPNIKKKKRGVAHSRAQSLSNQCLEVKFIHTQTLEEKLRLNQTYTEVVLKPYSYFLSLKDYYRWINLMVDYQSPILPLASQVFVFNENDHVYVCKTQDLKALRQLVIPFLQYLLYSYRSAEAYKELEQNLIHHVMIDEENLTLKISELVYLSILPKLINPTQQINAAPVLRSGSTNTQTYLTAPSQPSQSAAVHQYATGYQPDIYYYQRQYINFETQQFFWNTITREYGFLIPYLNYPDNEIRRMGKQLELDYLRSSGAQIHINREDGEFYLTAIEYFKWISRYTPRIPLSSSVVESFQPYYTGNFLAYRLSDSLSNLRIIGLEIYNEFILRNERLLSDISTHLVINEANHLLFISTDLFRLMYNRYQNHVEVANCTTCFLQSHYQTLNTMAARPSHSLRTTTRAEPCEPMVDFTPEVSLVPMNETTEEHSLIVVVDPTDEYSLVPIIDLSDEYDLVLANENHANQDDNGPGLDPELLTLLNEELKRPGF